MAENCKVYNLESFTDEERKRVEDLINQIEEEKKNKKKWWIVPKNSVFFNIDAYKIFGEEYYVEIQKNFYPSSLPPLKSDFNSKEEAEKYLENYLKEEKIFKSAKDEIDNLGCNIGHVVKKLQRHEYISNEDWKNCFARFNKSKECGDLSKVTKD